MGNAKNIDAVIPIYNLNKYSDNYSQTSGSLWQYYRDDEPALDADNCNVFDFSVVNAISNLFKQKTKDKKTRNRQQWLKRCWYNTTIKISN